MSESVRSYMAIGRSQYKIAELYLHVRACGAVPSAALLLLLILVLLSLIFLVLENLGCKSFPLVA